MNQSALRPVLSMACLASLTVTSLSAMETELALADDYYIGGELLNKQYDQGIIRNNDVTLHERAAGRLWDIGLSLDLWQAIGEDTPLTRKSTRGNVPQRAKFGQTTQCNIRFDYLIEMKNYFQILPYVQWINYPNLRDVPLKDNQWNTGLDLWYMTPFKGVEIGANVQYNPFYDVKSDNNGLGGWSSHHLLSGAFGSRQFLQWAPIDLSLWQMINYGNENQNRMIGGGNNLDPFFARDGWKTGFNMFDLGAMLIYPMPWKDWSLTMRAEGHFWMEHYQREMLSDANVSTKEFVIAIGMRWWPTAENKRP